MRGINEQAILFTLSAHAVERSPFAPASSSLHVMRARAAMGSVAVGYTFTGRVAEMSFSVIKPGAGINQKWYIYHFGGIYHFCNRQVNLW